MDEAFETYYALGHERDRLTGGSRRGRLELARTVELVERHLPQPPADVLDVGGGPGTHGRWPSRTTRTTSSCSSARSTTLPRAPTDCARSPRRAARCGREDCSSL